MNWIKTKNGGIIISIIAILGLYLFFSTMRMNGGDNFSTYEGFTTEEMQLAEEIATYLRGPSSYAEYVKLLITKKNKSINLAKRSTYKELVARRSELVAQDILDKF